MNDEQTLYKINEFWKFHLKDGMNWGGRVLACDSNFVKIYDGKSGNIVQIQISEIGFAVKLNNQSNGQGERC